VADGRALRVERRHEIGGLDHVGRAGVDRPAHRRPPSSNVGEDGAPGDAPASPVVHAVAPVGDAVPVAVLGMRDMTEAVPLARALGVPAREDVVVEPVTQIEHDVLRAGTVEQRRTRQLELEVQREHRPLPHRCGCRNESFRRQQIEASEHVVVAPQTPRRVRWPARIDRQLIVRRQRAVHAG
jgi:hypothetical protein